MLFLTAASKETMLAVDGVMWHANFCPNHHSNQSLWYPLPQGVHPRSPWTIDSRAIMMVELPGGPNQWKLLLDDGQCLVEISNIFLLMKLISKDIYKT